MSGPASEYAVSGMEGHPMLSFHQNTYTRLETIYTSQYYNTVHIALPSLTLTAPITSALGELGRLALSPGRD